FCCVRWCSPERRAARCWSFQKSGCERSSSSSARRAFSASGSKVTTDPVELGPDLRELLFERDLGLVGHPLGPVALLELFPRAAPAGVVAAELLVLARAHGLGHDPGRRLDTCRDGLSPARGLDRRGAGRGLLLGVDDPVG